MGKPEQDRTVGPDTPTNSEAEGREERTRERLRQSDNVTETRKGPRQTLSTVTAPIRMVGGNVSGVEPFQFHPSPQQQERGRRQEAAIALERHFAKMRG